MHANCDTIIALGNATKSGKVLFGKNSDREPDEAQNLVIVPRTKQDNPTVKCTYIEIPQIKETNRILLSKPFWIWGSEMGANEHGVIIGNEALFTKVKQTEEEKQGKLIGMDLLRLALERAESAKEALNTIINLLEEFGQGGNCGYRHKFYYMNGFIIADREEAYVLETVRKEWAWKKVKDVWSISNIISLQDDYDQCSQGLIETAIQEGWCSSKEDFNFRECYSNKLITWGAAGKERMETTRNYLQDKTGTLEVKDFINILRSHAYPNNENWRVDKGIKGTVCMHAGNTITRPDQTTCSLIGLLDKAHLEEEQVGKGIHKYRDLFLTTGASNPCLTPYFPIFTDKTDLPKEYRKGGKKFNPESYWWKLEKIHRKAIFSYKKAKEKLEVDLQKYERSLLEFLNKKISNNQQITQKEIDQKFQKALTLSTDWWNKIKGFKTDVKWITGFIFRRFWENYNKRNSIHFR